MSKVVVELPSNWALGTIDDTGEYINGFAFKPGHRTDSGLPIIRIQNLTDETKPIFKTNQQIDDVYKVDSGSLLVSWSATLDAFIWRRGEAFVNQHIFKVVPENKLIDPGLLYYWLKIAIADLQQTDHFHGSTMKHINRGPFMAHEIPIPPKNEQRRILEKIEELLSDHDNGVSELKTAQIKLRQYRQALLRSAVEGSLTQTWREQHQCSITETGEQLLARTLVERRQQWEQKKLEEFKSKGKQPPNNWQGKYSEPSQPNPRSFPTLPEGWTWTSVMSTGEVQLGRQRAPKYHSGDNMVPYLRVANVFEDRIDTSDVMSMHFSESDEESYRLKHGDVLLNEGQSLQLVGRPAIFKGELERACFTNTLVRYRPSANCLNEYALLVFRHYMHSGRFQKIAKITTNIAHLGAGRFAAIEFPLPSLAEQAEVVDIFNHLSLKLEKQLDDISVGLKQAEYQRKNILKCAMSGKLVPQDPTDEPASRLLEKIRAEREDRTKRSKVRKSKAKPKKETSTVAKKMIDVLTEVNDWLTAQDLFKQCGVSDGAGTDEIEALYAQLRELDQAKRISVEPVMDNQGRKLHDRLKLVAAP